MLVMIYKRPMISVYIKTHLKTKKKYLGKTSKKDVKKYKGSGKYWKNHIGKYGYNVSTIIIRQFDNVNECSDFCLWYSKINDIVDSEDWCNMRLENGKDGWVKGLKRSPESCLKMSKSKTGVKRKPFTDEHRKNLRISSRIRWDRVKV